MHELRPDVLLLDLALPYTDGLEVIRRLAEERVPTGIVVASGFACKRMAPLAIALGAHSYFEKGASPEELRDKVRAACSAMHRKDAVPSSTDG